MKIVALAGGVGGAKLADGLAQIQSSEDLTIIVNTGDDFEHLGLFICPDLDTVCYTLAGLANPETGWGRADETWQVFENITRLGGPDWFNLGDQDLATHLERTRRLRAGHTLSQITRHFCTVWGISPTVLPMSDQPVPTIVLTDEGELPFQEYFVHLKCVPKVRGFRFQGVENARPAPGVIEKIRNADLIVICPSNPWVSIGPILALPSLKAEIASRLVVAVSPIIGGKAVKGPAAKMYAELGIQPSALAVAEHYQDIIDGFVFDIRDKNYVSDIQQLNVITLTVQTIMNSRAQQKCLAEDILDLVNYTWRK